MKFVLNELFFVCREFKSWLLSDDVLINVYFVFLKGRDMVIWMLLKLPYLYHKDGKCAFITAKWY